MGNACNKSLPSRTRVSRLGGQTKSSTRQLPLTVASVLLGWWLTLERVRVGHGCSSWREVAEMLGRGRVNRRNDTKGTTRTGTCRSRSSRFLLSHHRKVFSSVLCPRSRMSPTLRIIVWVELTWYYSADVDPLPNSPFRPTCPSRDADHVAPPSPTPHRLNVNTFKTHPLL